MVQVNQIGPRYPRDRCEQYGQRIAILLEQGNFELAKSIVGEAEAELNSSEEGLISRRPLAAILEESIPDLPSKFALGGIESLIAQVVNGLEEKLGVLYVYQLLDTDIDAVLQISGIGDRAIELLVEGLASVGFFWPVDRIEKQPIQAMIDDEYALRLQQCGMLTVGTLMDSDLQSRLEANDFLSFEAATIQRHLTAFLANSSDSYRES